MSYIIKEKINVGISACNFGALTRYNRKGWDKLAFLGREKDAFIWTPVCPEVMSGLGVPRPAMKLVDGNGDDFWENNARMKNRNGQNVSVQMKKGALMALENIKNAGVEAFVFMDGSPSCGVYRTTLKNARLGKPPGVFGSLLLKEQLFLIPALDLDSPVKWWDWRRRLHMFIYLKRMEIKSTKELMDIWHDYKFVAQELSRKEADEIGRNISALSAKIDSKRLGKIKCEILNLIRKPSDIKRIKAAAEKQMSFLCKHMNVCYIEKLPSSETGKKKFFERLLELENDALKKGIKLGFIPVVYRESR